MTLYHRAAVMEQKAIKALATTTERAKTLFADGYKLDPVPGKPGVYTVTRPTPRIEKRTGEIIESYTVRMTAHGAICNCPQYQSRSVNGERDCKHAKATRDAVAEALRIAGPFLQAPPRNTNQAVRSQVQQSKPRGHNPWALPAGEPQPYIPTDAELAQSRRARVAETMRGDFD